MQLSYTNCITHFIQSPNFQSPPVSYLHAGCELGIDALESLTDNEYIIFIYHAGFIPYNDKQFAICGDTLFRISYLYNYNSMNRQDNNKTNI